MDYTIGSASPLYVFEQNFHLYRVDEVDYLLRLFDSKKLSDELAKMLQPNIRKALSTVEFLLSETLGEGSLSDEMDPLAIELGGTEKSDEELKECCEKLLKTCRNLF